MTTKIQLLGHWPDKVETQLEAVVPKEVIVERVGRIVLGVIPWGDVTSLISATAAVISVAISFISLKRDGIKEGAQHPDSLTKAIKRDGIFGVKISSVIISDGNEKNFKIMVSDETSAVNHGFIVIIENGSISISIKQED